MLAHPVCTAPFACQLRPVPSGSTHMLGTGAAGGRALLMESTAPCTRWHQQPHRDEALWQAAWLELPLLILDYGRNSSLSPAAGSRGISCPQGDLCPCLAISTEVQGRAEGEAMERVQGWRFQSKI